MWHFKWKVIRHLDMCADHFRFLILSCPWASRCPECLPVDFPASVQTRPRQARPRVKRWLPSLEKLDHRVGPPHPSQSKSVRSGEGRHWHLPLWPVGDGLSPSWKAENAFIWSPLFHFLWGNSFVRTKSLSWTCVVPTISTGGLEPLNFTCFLSLFFLFFCFSK